MTKHLIFKHLIIGIQKLESNNIAEVSKSLHSILKAGEKVNSKIVFAIRDDNNFEKYLTINKKYIISGGLRSYARNQGMNHLKQYADNNTIVHFIDCDQIVNINTFKYLEKKYFNTQCKNNVVGTLRYNILKNNTFQSDIRYKKFTPNWDTMYTNFLSLNYNLINTNKKFVMFNELFTKWGHEDLLYNYEIFKLNNKKVNYFFNKIYPTKHFEHKENTDSGIKNLQIIQQLYPELYSWINKKIKSLNSEKRSGF